MKDNPVLRESLDIFFGEGHGFAVYFYLLIILAPVEFFSLYLPSLDAQMWSGSANLFKVCAVTALLLTVYLALRVANQEFAPWRFKPVKRWVRENGLAISAVGQGQLAFLSLHVALSILLCTPLLIWAGAIARTPFSRVSGTFLLLLPALPCHFCRIALRGISMSRRARKRSMLSFGTNSSQLRRKRIRTIWEISSRITFVRDPVWM